MKICFLNIFQGKVNRGLETYVYELSKRLEAENEVQIISAESKPLKRWPVLWRLFLDPHGISIFLFTLKNLKKIWKEKYDIVFALNGGWQPAIVRIITWIYGGKMIISGQSGKGWDDRNNLWCFPDCFVALSSDAAIWARKANPFVFVEVIPNGVDLNTFKPDGNRYQTKLKKPIVICQGAAEPSKRLDLAITAISQLENVSLLMVGSGSLEKVIRKRGLNILGDRFEMISVPHKIMPSIYRAADIFTLPSEDTEAFGISIIEAMATNIPVVVTDNSVRRSITGDSGIFVDPTDTGKYANALKKALKTKWGNIPRDRAKSFDWEKIAGSYTKLFKKLYK